MSTKDGLLAGGVAVAIILSAVALLSRHGDAVDQTTPDPERLATIQSVLEGKLAEGESRARSLEDKLGRIEKRVASLESRKPPAAAAGDTPVAVVIEVPEVIPVDDLIQEWELDVGATEANAPSRFDLTRGLVGWWKFDDKAGTVARDSSGKGHDGKLIGRPRWRKGRLGRALEFDGRDDFVELAGRAGTGFMHDEFSERTICLWVRQNAAAKAGDVFDEGGISTGIAIRLGAEGLTIGCRNFDVPTMLPRMGPLSLKTWHHIAVIFDHGFLQAFIDGRRKASARAAYTIISKHNDPAGLGACGRSDVLGRRDIGGLHFTGLLDDVRIYDRALAPEEVEALASGRESVAPQSPPENTDPF